MQISTKGRYALRMLLDLAEHQNDGYIALKGNSPRKSKAYMDTASISKQIHTETSIA